MKTILIAFTVFWFEGDPNSLEDLSHPDTLMLQEEVAIFDKRSTCEIIEGMENTDHSSPFITKLKETIYFCKGESDAEE